MNNLKECRGSTKQTELLKGIKVVDKRVDIGLLSKYENGVALPTPPQLQAICDTLGVVISDIYTENELDFEALSPQATATVKEVKVRKQPTTYHISVRVNGKFRNLLTKKNLKIAGYATLAEWVRQCMRLLEIEVTKNKNRPTDEAVERLDRKAKKG
jgi:transcriptional regulator with XRE-family HTH domain